MIAKFLNTSFKINLLLFICGFSIYFIYFYPVLLHPNSVLSSIYADALKNYYTFMFHIKNDESFFHFNDLNFPFGEHIVYTDCQPLLSFLLRCLPFTHDYLIGILHLFIFLSFIITPLILNSILLRQNIDKLSSFFISLAVVLLSPQYSRLLAGHYALTYMFIIPLCIVLLLNVIENKTLRNISLLSLFNTALFFLHPYFGFGCCVFSFFNLNDV